MSLPTGKRLLRVKKNEFWERDTWQCYVYCCQQKKYIEDVENSTTNSLGLLYQMKNSVYNVYINAVECLNKYMLTWCRKGRRMLCNDKYILKQSLWYDKINLFDDKNNSFVLY